MNDVKNISTVETAKLIRKQLKKAFPKAKFSVRSDRYAGGSAIRVSWFDGPSVRVVETITNPFRGAGFDGMIDMKYHKDSWLLPDGSAVLARSSGTTSSRGVVDGFSHEKPHPEAILVSFGADYVTTSRDFSPEFVQAVAAEYQQISGLNIPEIETSSDGKRAWFKMSRTWDDESIDHEYRQYLHDFSAVEADPVPELVVSEPKPKTNPVKKKAPKKTAKPVNKTAVKPKAAAKEAVTLTQTPQNSVRAILKAAAVNILTLWLNKLTS